ncbi:MAG: hypothetical protein JWR84_1112 [Caulobacter sp.]|nr:hypothetical protein [Caulobacter sp.]
MPTQRLETTHFALDLADDWREVEADDPDRFIFESEARDTSLTISIVPMAEPFEALGQVARRFVESRIDAHLSGAQELGWLFEMTEPQIVARDFGQMVAYHGRLLAGGRFDFAGLVLPTGVISLFVESDTASEETLAATLSEVASGMEI